MRTVIAILNHRHNSLSLSDLGGGGIGFAVTSSSTYNNAYRAFAGVRQWHQRRALIVLYRPNGGRTFVYQNNAVRWIIQPYGGKSCLRQQYFVTSQENNKKNM